MNICVVGTGYVGLVTGACLADLGNRVICVDRDAVKVGKLRNGVVPIYEPGLEDVVNRNVAAGRLEFTTCLRYGADNSDIIFIAVGTPSLPDGDVDLSWVKAAAEEIGHCITGYRIIVNKSTVPVGTQKMVTEIIRESLSGDCDFDVVSNPEFLREGSAVYDTMHADRVVVGADSKRAAEVMAELYKPLGCPVMITDPESAEMIKYASNAFLATKITFINEIANLCERLGGDVAEVARGMGLDSRISGKCLRAGIGFGGSCFPKDTRGMVMMGKKAGYSFEILNSVIKVNDRQKLKPVEKLKDALEDPDGSTVGILGLAFKPGTDDMREAPSIDIIKAVQGLGGRVKAYDPAAMPNAEKVLEDVRFCSNPYEALEGADAALLLTEWEEFRRLDLNKVKGLMRRPVFIDGRNVFDAGRMTGLGFRYYCVGRRDCGCCRHY